MTKVVVVCTSATSLGGHTTGLWLEELAAPYQTFTAAGFEVVLASPKGGPIPLDEASLGGDFFTDASKKFLHDAAAVGALSHSLAVSDIDFASGVDAIYMTGGHGAVADFIGNAALRSAIETMHQSGKVVGAVCHGVIALSECMEKDGTTPFVQGKKMTCFVNSEEAAVQLEKFMPFPIETRFREQGAEFSKGADWSCNVCVDGKLVTGQNPQSSEAVGEAIVKLLTC